jgi:hypothetical protein
MLRAVLPDLDWLPRPPDLERDPELALLAVLHTALQVTVYALVAVHPQLATDSPLPADPNIRAANKVLVTASRLQRALDEYRRVLAQAAARLPLPSADNPSF